MYQGSMKTHLFIGLLTLGALLSSPAGTCSLGDVNGSGTSLNLEIPDGDNNGVASTIDVSGAGNALSHVTVTLNISGGCNGDLYAYLSCNGKLVTLLNRVGVSSSDTIGSVDSGLHNVTLASTGSDVHLASAGGRALAGSCQADGRQNSPLSATAGVNANERATLDGSFAGMNPNGKWTLFVADLSEGGISTLEGWSLDITTVPDQSASRN
jgi:subtilisin-like proprotein convertase family protein